MSSDEAPATGILVADHKPHMASLITQMLRSLGHKDIREAYDASRAMIELQRRSFGLLIIESEFEGLDGVSFTRKLRLMVDSPNRHIPIIMMSSAPDRQRIADARDAGVTEFLRKPFAANHLQTRLQSIQERPRGFIEVSAYTGPDRRRRTLQVEDDRRGDPSGD